MGSDVCLVAGVFIWVPFIRFLANPSWHARHTLIQNVRTYLRLGADGILPADLSGLQLFPLGITQDADDLFGRVSRFLH